MCPACMPSAAVMIGGVMSTGGVTAFVVRIVRSILSAKHQKLQNKTTKEKAS